MLLVKLTLCGGLCCYTVEILIFWPVINALNPMPFSCDICANVRLQILSYFSLTEVKMATQVSKKRKFIADGVFKAELNEFLTRFGYLLLFDRFTCQ